MAASFLDELLQSPVDPNPPLDGQKSAFPSMASRQQGTNMAQALLTTQIVSNTGLVANPTAPTQHMRSVQLSTNADDSTSSSPMLTRVLPRAPAAPPGGGAVGPTAAATVATAAAVAANARQPVPIAPRPTVQSRSLAGIGALPQRLATPSLQQQPIIAASSVGGSSVPSNGQTGSVTVAAAAAAAAATAPPPAQQQQQQEQPSDKVKKFLNNLVMLANKTSSESGAMVTDLVKQLVVRSLGQVLSIVTFLFGNVSLLGSFLLCFFVFVFQSGSLSEELFVQQMGESQTGSTTELLSLLKARQ